MKYWRRLYFHKVLIWQDEVSEERINQQTVKMAVAEYNSVKVQEEGERIKPTILNFYYMVFELDNIDVEPKISDAEPTEMIAIYSFSGIEKQKKTIKDKITEKLEMMIL